MFEGAKNINLRHDSLADFGAQRTLGMSGSLMGYIQTGNRYDKRYYRPDYYYPSYKNQIRRNHTINKISAVFVSLLAVVAATFGVIKCQEMGLKAADLVDAAKKVAKQGAKKAKEGIDAAKNGASKLKLNDKIKTAGSKTGGFLKKTGAAISGFFKGIVSKFKKKP